ncbi:MAG: hypothetical protein LBR17_03500, partial [Bacteroidales bacterium]|nr:hypothetical protein [Bacteroidales bacterium]
SFDNFDDLEQCYYAVFEVNVFGFVVSGSPNPQYNYKPIIQKEKPIYIDKIEIEEICNEK